MSYHDGYQNLYTSDPDDKGMSVINPLHRIQTKLTKVRQLLEEMPDDDTMTASELRQQLLDVIND
tara:strand:+ start:796 stop:990 length:195 start_codon:yes stop_codon:yes gene_type:complete